MAASFEYTKREVPHAWLLNMAFRNLTGRDLWLGPQPLLIPAGGHAVLCRYHKTDGFYLGMEGRETDAEGRPRCLNLMHGTGALILDPDVAPWVLETHAIPLVFTVDEVAGRPALYSLSPKTPFKIPQIE